MGDSEGDMVGDSCLVRPLRCSAPGDKVRGLMGAGRRRGELLDRRREELMEGLLRDDWSWQLLRDAWIEGLLRDEDRPEGQNNVLSRVSKESLKHVDVDFPACTSVVNTKHWAVCETTGAEEGNLRTEGKQKS